MKEERGKKANDLENDIAAVGNHHHHPEIKTSQA